jgi:transposase
MGPHPAELRQRVVEAYLNGEGSYRDLAERFAVSLHFVTDMVALHRRTGALAPKPHAGGGKTLGPAGDAALWALVAEDPDATLAELQARLQTRMHRTLTLSGVWRALQRLGLPRKKSRSTQASRRGPTSSPGARPSRAA